MSEVLTVSELKALYLKGNWWFAFQKAIAQVERLEAQLAAAEAREQALRALAGQVFEATCAERCGDYGHDWHAASCPKTQAENALYVAIRALTPPGAGGWPS